MGRLRSSRTLASFVLAAGVAITACRHERLCTLIGCESGGSVELAQSLTNEDVASAEIIATWNGSAWHGRLARIAPYLDKGEYGWENILEADLPHAESPTGVTSVTVDRRRESDWSVGVTFRIPVDSVRVGDRVEARVRRDDGTELASFTGRVTRTSDFHPNGPGCGFCRRGTIE
jgi:hypothetical protein